MRMAILVLAALLVGGCGKDDKAAGGAGKEAAKGPDPKAELAAFEKDVLPKIPKAEGITFEARLVDKDRVVMAVPKGWAEANHFPGMFDAPDELGFGTKVSAGTSCSGACQPKDWKPVIDKRVAQYLERKDTFEVIADKQLENPAGRLVVAKTKDGKKIYIAGGRYKEGASRYFACDAVLNGKAVAFQDAFVAVCEQAVALPLK